MIQRRMNPSSVKAEAPSDSTRRRRLESLLEQPIPWEVVLAERSISVPALLELGVGSVIVLGAADRPAELRAGGADVADGEVVRLEGSRLGVQLGEVRPRREILAEIELDADVDEGNDEDEATKNTRLGE